MFLYSTVVFTLNLCYKFIGSCFCLTLLAPKRVQKAQRRQNAVTRSSAHEFSLGENIAFGELRLRSLIIASKLAFYSLARTLSRSSFACRQLSLDSRGMRKFGRASVARQKTCTSFPRLSAAVACDFDSAVFF